MKIRYNCTIDKIFSRIEQGESNAELQFLMERINDYKKSTEKQVGFYLDKYYDDYLDVKDTKHFMTWVEKNVPTEYKGYVRKKYLRTSYFNFLCFYDSSNRIPDWNQHLCLV